MSERVPLGGPFKAAMGMHEPQTLEPLREARRQLSTYCASPSEVCGKYLEVIVEVSSRMAAVRLEDIAARGAYEGIDKPVIVAYKKLLEIYSKYLAGLFIVWGDQLLVELSGSVEVKGKMLNKGDLVNLSLEEALGLILSGLAKPIESIALRKEAPTVRP
ncbi:MAG: hypothetical protein P3X22_006540 [Thermoprotei archaeon]|nr:hypothetical protein [Thermoprotei archaeon]